jgi:uncharacterized membrane protein YcaP (DUF421 family)
MELMIRATVLYWFLFLIMRGLGKRSVAEFSPLDLLVVVVMGDLVQIGITQEDLSITGAVMTISAITAWTVVGDWAVRRWPWARRGLVGTPVVVVRDGAVLTDHLRRERLTVEDLDAAARSKGYDDLGDVAIAVLEEDGSVSFIGAKSSSDG